MFSSKPGRRRGGERLALVALLVISTAVCGDSGEGARPVVERSDSAGIEIVTHSGTADSLGTTEDLRIGALDDGAQELLFYNVRDILVDRNGRIFVANDQTATVRVFTRDGQFVREFGGRGEGPREIPGSLNDLIWAGDDLALVDWQGTGRTVMYDTAGTFLDSWGHRSADVDLTPTAWHPDGFVVTESDDAVFDGLALGKAYPAGRRLRLVASPDSLGEVIVELPPIVLYGSVAAQAMVFPLFMPWSMTTFDRDGTHYRHGGAPYQIDIRRPDGALNRSLRRRVDPRPLTDVQVEAIRVEVAIFYDTTSRYEGAPARARAAKESRLELFDEQATFPRPEYHPVLGQMLVGGDAIWVERVDRRDPVEHWVTMNLSGPFGSASPAPTRWDVFTADGDLRGTLTLPPRFRPFAVTADAVVGVEQDELDVEYVVRYRIVE